MLPCEKSSLKRTSAWANWARAMALKSFIIFSFRKKTRIESFSGSNKIRPRAKTKSRDEAQNGEL